MDQTEEDVTEVYKPHPIEPSTEEEKPEASLPQCEEAEPEVRPPVVIDDSQPIAFPVVPPSGEADEQEEEAAVFELASTDSAAAVDDGVAGDDVVGEEVVPMIVEEIEPTSRSGGRRKRGRPPRVQAARAPAKKKEKDVFAKDRWNCEEEVSEVYKPHPIERWKEEEPEASLPQCEEAELEVGAPVGVHEEDDSQIIASPVVPPSGEAEEEQEESAVFEPASTDSATAVDDDVAGDDVVGEEVVPMAVEETEPTTRSGGRRKRGRPPRGGQAARAPAKKKEKREEEDVCFICFDGGDLVVCDRRGCPKVYHPSCVNRDEAFFRAKGRWNCGYFLNPKYRYSATCRTISKEVRTGMKEVIKRVLRDVSEQVHAINQMEHYNAGLGSFGDVTARNAILTTPPGWHICSICEKAAHYMCYTCTYSLCKGCIKEAKFVCVRGNKGFCETCMGTVMLIETNEHANEKMVGVDFDDKTSWEYLFKDYWLGVKGKLSLTLEELTRAKSPWKEPDVSARNDESSDELYDANDDQGASSDSSSGRREGSISGRKKVKRRSRAATEEIPVKEVGCKGTFMPENTDWASKELLEFVAHMKDGDKSVLSQFDVQALLLEYIKRNNLRDPRRKSQIICDPRLQNLFGKARVGHFEMLKLLESHFLIKEASQVVTDDNQGGVVDPDSSLMDIEGNTDSATKMSSDKRRKTRKRVEEREPQNNLNDFAAIDVHNINLIYLRRNLMEDLIDDIDEFNDRVVGSFVRIRISGAGQRQDMYRLVQVVGTQKAAEKYKTGKKTTDITLEILNLNKKEVITIDIISNQEFTEEECKRLRQSIKCGFIDRLTVGEVQEKAKALQTVRVSDWLESEKLRLGHLRDRASEKGRRKELRECVEKLQLLSMPEERTRRLNEAPVVHSDPNMDPNYESAEDEGEPDDKKRDSYGRPRESASLRKGREVISPGKGGSISNNTWNDSRKSSNTTWESNRSTPTEGTWDKIDPVDRTNELSWNQGKDVHQTNNRDTQKIEASATSLEAGVWNNNQLMIKSGESSGAAVDTTAASLSNTSATEKMWHYQDPSGKNQGPFSMTQLRKWSTTGYFPPNLRIWRASEKQEDAILLTDALVGKFQKELAQREPQNNTFSQPMKVAAVMDSRGNSREGGWGGSNHPTWRDNNQNGGNWKASQSNATFSATGNKTELGKADGRATQPSTWSAPKTDLLNPKGERISSRGWESSKDTNAWSGPHVHNSPRATAPFPGNQYQAPPYQGRGGRGGNTGRWNGGPDRGNTGSSSRPRGFQPSGQGYERQYPNWSSSNQQSSGGTWKAQATNDSSNQWRADSFNPSTPTPKPSSGGWSGGEGVLNRSASSAAPVQPMNSGWGDWGHQTPTAAKESNITASTTTVGGWGSNTIPVPNQTRFAGGWDSSPAASVSMADAAKVSEAVPAAQIPTRTNDLQIAGQQNKPSEPDADSILGNQMRSETIPAKGATFVGGSTTTELSTRLDKDQCSENDCPSPTPRCEQVSSQRNDKQGLHNDVDPGKRWPEAHDKSATESRMISVSDNMQSKSTILAEDVDEKGRTGLEGKQIYPSSSNSVANEANLVADVASSEAGCPGFQDRGSEDVKPTVEAHVSESDSAQRSEASPDPKDGSESQGKATAAAQEQHPDGSSPAGHEWELSQSQKPEPSFSVPKPLNTGNLVVRPDTKSSEWSLPSPTPTIKSSGWDVGADSTTTNNPLVLSDSSKLVAVPAQSNMNVAPQNPNTGAGSAQGNENTSWGTAIPINANAGWSPVAQGNMNMAWGTPAQGNAIMNAGWGTPPQGNTNVNMGWGAPVQGTPNPNAGWVAPTQGNPTLNPNWGTPTQGNSNMNAGWVTPTLGNANQNPSWGTPAQGNTNAIANAGWGTGQENMSATHPSAGNPNRQNGDRYSGGQGERILQGNDGSGRQPWNRMQSGGGGGGGGGGSSRPPPREGPRGVCRFHESGHCKKGASCYYLHP